MYITTAEAEPIVARWIDQAAEQIEAVTGSRPSSEDLMAELADREWLFCGGEDENGEEQIDIYSLLRQLWQITEEEIDNRAGYNLFDKSV